MGIGRVEIAFGSEDNDDMFEIMDNFKEAAEEFFGNRRWVHVSVSDEVEDEYELGFEEEEPDEMEPALARALMQIPDVWREAAEMN